MKSRLGNELLFTQGPMVSLWRGLRSIKHWFELCGDMQLQALAGLCMGRADQTSDPNCELELRHCVVAETCFVSEKCSGHSCFYFPKLHQCLTPRASFLGDWCGSAADSWALTPSTTLNLNQLSHMIVGEMGFGVGFVRFPYFLELPTEVELFILNRQQVNSR